jgi:aspartyl protease family protein
MRAWFVLALLIGGGLLLLMRSGGFDTISSLGTGELVSIAVGVLLVIVYIFSLVNDERTRPLQAVRYILVWLAIGFALIGGYSYREELSSVVSRVGGELRPAGEVVTVESGEEGDKAVRVRRRLDGHFAVRAAVNGQSMTLMVDTGATSVVLKPADAERAGINLDDLSYTTPIDTANGTTFAAAVRLKSLAIGPLVVNNIEALVARPGSINENLLGMSFLRRLRSYEFTNDYLTLRG